MRTPCKFDLHEYEEYDKNGPFCRELFSNEGWIEDSKVMSGEGDKG